MKRTPTGKMLWYLSFALAGGGLGIIIWYAVAGLWQTGLIVGCIAVGAGILARVLGNIHEFLFHIDTNSYIVRENSFETQKILLEKMRDIQVTLAENLIHLKDSVGETIDCINENANRAQDTREASYDALRHNLPVIEQSLADSFKSAQILNALVKDAMQTHEPFMEDTFKSLQMMNALLKELVQSLHKLTTFYEEVEKQLNLHK